MPNLHNKFLQFESKISVSDSRKAKLTASRKALEKRLVEYFKVKTNMPIPKFYIQGSYKMNTMILDRDGMYDVDLGIYFLTKPNVQPPTLQNYIFAAVNGHTQYGTEHREKCIRVIYSRDFDIDLPVYYKTANHPHPFLATKKGWVESDPKELCDWFKNKKDKGGQLIRIIKYLKAWANNTVKKMPSGIALTVWATNSFKSHQRDDIALFETLKEIKNALFWSIACINPATPGDDLISRLTDTHKRNFAVALNLFIKVAEQAIQSDNPQIASKIWKQQLGDKFPN